MWMCYIINTSVFTFVPSIYLQGQIGTTTQLSIPMNDYNIEQIKEENKQYPEEFKNFIADLFTHLEYIQKKLTKTKVGKSLGVSDETIRNWMKKERASK